MYFVRAGARRKGHEIGLVTVIREMQDTAKRDKIEIDVARATRKKEKKDERGKEGWDESKRKGHEFRSTVGRERDDDQEISQTRRQFLFFLTSHGRRHRRGVECMNEVIRTNVTTAFSLSRVCEATRANKAKSVHRRVGIKGGREGRNSLRARNVTIYVFLERRESIDESADTQAGRPRRYAGSAFEKQRNDDVSVTTRESQLDLWTIDPLLIKVFVK